MKKVKILPIKWVEEKHDTDGDGFPNCKDCDPWNPHKDSSPFGVYYIGNDKYGVYQQQLMGASNVKRGKPLFIGTKFEANQFLGQIPPNPEFYDAK